MSISKIIVRSKGNKNPQHLGLRVLIVIRNKNYFLGESVFIVRFSLPSESISITLTATS